MVAKNLSTPLTLCILLFLLPFRWSRMHLINEEKNKGIKKENVWSVAYLALFMASELSNFCQ